MKYHANQNQDPDGQQNGSVRAAGRRRVPTAKDGANSRWTFGTPRVALDRNKAGTHAGLPHVVIAVQLDGARVGYIDVHLHHNARGLSVGTTMCLYDRSVETKEGA